MLESATIRRPGLYSGGYDVGRILETLLYYRRLHLVLDMQSFSGLAMAIGLRGLQKLLQRNDVTATFLNQFPAVQSENSGIFQMHRPIFGQLLGNEPNDVRPVKLLYNSIAAQEKFKGLRIKDLSQIIKLGNVSNYGTILGDQVSFDDIFFSLATDETTLKLGLAAEYSLLGIAIDTDKLDCLRIEAHRVDGQLMLLSDQEPGSLTDQPTGIGWARVLAKLQDYSIDSVISQRQSTDLIGTTEVRGLASSRIDLSLQRAHRSAEKIHAFQTVVFEGAGGLAEAYNQGRVSFDDALRLIDRSTRFREWLVGLPPDAEILGEYHRALAKEGVTDKLPAVTARFAFFTAAGAGIDALAGTAGLGTAAGMGLSAFDTFVVDKLLRGWRPNVFVEAAKRTVGED
jgi:hypothetical protein